MTSGQNLRGITLMLVSMALFAVEDMFIKIAARDIPPGQIILIAGLFGLPPFLWMARRGGHRVFSRAALHPAGLARAAGEMVGSLAYIIAISSVPLPTVSAVLQVLPLAVTLGAALFMGETVGWRRWSAIAVGLSGVLLVIRPGFDGFSPTAMWVLVTVAALAVRDLATRAIPPDCSDAQISSWGLMSVALLGAMMMAWSGEAVTPDATQAAGLAAMVVFGAAGYWAITAASRTGEVSVVAPFRYSRLVFAILIGAFVFDEAADALTLAGSALIIGSGIYSFARERARKRALSMAGPAG